MHAQRAGAPFVLMDAQRGRHQLQRRTRWPAGPQAAKAQQLGPATPATLQAIGANGWTVDGYTFIGWNTSADGKGTAYAPGTTWIANGTLTLYAQWTPGQAGLTYDGNGATGGKTDPQPGKTDEKINVRRQRNHPRRIHVRHVEHLPDAGARPSTRATSGRCKVPAPCTPAGPVPRKPLPYHGNGATGGNYRLYNPARPVTS